jgi:chemotaxis response regulator CheB
VTITVALGDDHTLVREGLRRVIETATGIEVLGEASTGSDMVRLATETGPDVAVLDIRMPEMDGIEASDPGSRAPDPGGHAHGVRRSPLRRRGPSGPVPAATC